MRTSIHVVVAAAAIVAALTFMPSVGRAGCPTYEATSPPWTSRAVAATSYYVEFAARSEITSYGHSFVSLGVVDSAGRRRPTLVAGFQPKGRIDDCLGAYALPVAAIVGVSRPDFARAPVLRFRSTL